MRLEPALPPPYARTVPLPLPDHTDFFPLLALSHRLGHRFQHYDDAPALFPPRFPLPDGRGSPLLQKLGRRKCPSSRALASPLSSPPKATPHREPLPLVPRKKRDGRPRSRSSPSPFRSSPLRPFSPSKRKSRAAPFSPSLKKPFPLTAIFSPFQESFLVCLCEDFLPLSTFSRFFLRWTSSF